MKLAILLLAVFLYLPHTQASDKAPFTFLDAVTLCSDNENPFVRLIIINGHRFGDITTSYDVKTSTTTFKAVAIRSMHSHNQAILSPDTVVGTLVVTMRYVKKGADIPLVCTLTEE